MKVAAAAEAALDPCIDSCEVPSFCLLWCNGQYLKIVCTNTQPEILSSFEHAVECGLMLGLPDPAGEGDQEWQARHVLHVRLLRPGHCHWQGSP